MTLGRLAVRHVLAAAALSAFVGLIAAADARAQGAGYTAPSVAPHGRAQTIEIAQGSLQGSVADGVGWFLGIPYARPPVGDLRWRPPGAPPIWRGVRHATQAGSMCAAQEDCLFLNVLRPADAKAHDRLPVMVWLHGGGFVNGTSLGGYGGDTDGREFARHGVIVVSVNYRLGRAGWFSHPALSREGGPHSNYGFLDQIAALKWVKANIASFGGDPGNVTLFGESAGGASVLYLMISPLAEGLFDRAIAQSSYARYVPVPLAVAEEQGLELARAAGVEGIDATAAKMLRALPLSALPVNTGGDPGRRSPGLDGRPYPVVDGLVIPSSIMTAFEDGRAARVPLIIGGNANEASRIKPSLRLLETMPDVDRAGLLEVFDPDGSGDLMQVVNDFVTVEDITEPDRAAARLHAGNGAPVWVYYFSHTPTAKREERRYGPGHTDELPFVFMSPRASLHPEDMQVAHAMNAYWVEFAKHGDPGAAGGILWPRWWIDSEGEMEFASEGPIVRWEFRKAWRDFVESHAASSDLGNRVP